MRHVRSRVEVLSQREIERIHSASLEILRDVGIRVPNERLLSRLRVAGAEVQGDTARLPAALLERMLAECIGSPRHRRTDRGLRHRQPVRTTNGNETVLLEYPGLTRRPGLLEDVLKGIALTNALPSVGWALPVVVPGDVPQPLAEVESYRLGCLYSAKPFNVYFSLAPASYLMRMAALLARVRGCPQREVGLGFSFGVVSPLRYAEKDLACAMLTSDAGWPTNCYSFVTVGASSPASMAGALVLSNAERLACLTLMWLWGEIGGYQPGFVDDPCMLEPRTLATSFGHPNLTTLAIATSQLSRYYGLGSGGGGLALSDAKQIDYQDGFERGMGAAFNVLAGGGVGNSGIVGPDEAMSFEQLVIDDAGLSAVNWVRQGIEVTDETMAVGLIKEVGIAGTFLDREHTARAMRREYWDSPVFTRQSWANWERGGRQTLVERAHREVVRLLAEGYPPPCLVPPEAARDLDRITEEARAELGEGPRNP